jgi:hypothetical protein
MEYMALLGAKFGLDGSFNTQIAWIVLSGLVLTGVGFAVKGVLGAIVALAIGGMCYMYWNGMCPF